MPLYQRGQGAVKRASHHGAHSEGPEPGDTGDTGDGEGPEAEPTIVIEDEGLRAGFTQLPNYVFRIRGLSHGAKLTYALLLSYAWQKDSCFPGQQTLADDLDVSVRSVSDYLRELQDRGLIRVQRRGLGKTNVYHILRLDGAAGPTGGGRGEAHAHSSARSADRQAPPDRQPVASPDQQNPAHLERKRGAAPERKRGVDTEAQPAADKKHKPAQRPSPREEAAQQQGGAAADPARAVLARWGIAEPRLVAELCARPAEVLRQGAALEEHLTLGRRIANPAGWLIEAVRAGYGRPAAGGELPPSASSEAIAGGLSWPGGSARERGQLSLLTPAGAAFAEDDPGAADEAGLWAVIRRELAETTTAANFRRWFAPLCLLREEPGSLVVGVPDAGDREWLEHRLRGTVERAAEAVLGHRPTVSFAAVPAKGAGTGGAADGV